MLGQPCDVQQHNVFGFTLHESEVQMYFSLRPGFCYYLIGVIPAISPMAVRYAYIKRK